MRPHLVREDFGLRLLELRHRTNRRYMARSRTHFEKRLQHTLCKVRSPDYVDVACGNTRVRVSLGLRLQAASRFLADRGQNLSGISLQSTTRPLPTMPSTFSRRLHASCCVILWGFQAQAFRSMAKGVNCLRPTSQFLSFSGARRAPSLVIQIRLRHLARGRVPDVPAG